MPYSYSIKQTKLQPHIQIGNNKKIKQFSCWCYKKNQHCWCALREKRSMRTNLCECDHISLYCNFFFHIYQMLFPTTHHTVDSIFWHRNIENEIEKQHDAIPISRSGNLILFHTELFFLFFFCTFGFICKL